MYLSFLKSKIHKAKVTECDLHYEGSISIDLNYMEKVGIFENEKVDVLNLNNGSRISTYAIASARFKQNRSKCAAARTAQVGDLVIILSYALISHDEAPTWKPEIIILN